MELIKTRKKDEAKKAIDKGHVNFTLGHADDLCSWRTDGFGRLSKEEGKKTQTYTTTPCCYQNIQISWISRGPMNGNKILNSS